jgi:hypothetical protein
MATAGYQPSLSGANDGEVNGGLRMCLIGATPLAPRRKCVPSMMGLVLEVQPPAFAQREYSRNRPLCGILRYRRGWETRPQKLQLLWAKPGLFA